MNNIEQGSARALAQLKSIEGLIFDLDGTILDSMPMWNNLCVDYFKRYGMEFKEEFLKGINAPSFFDTIKALRDKFFPHIDLEAMTTEWSEYLIYHYQNTVTIKPGVIEFMQKMQAENKKICLATMTERQYVNIVLKHFHLDDYLLFAKTVGEIGKTKNHPDIYLAAAAEMGLEPEKCLILEDSCSAAKTARGAGFLVWGVADPSAEQDRSEMQTICHNFVEDFRTLL